MRGVRQQRRRPGGRAAAWSRGQDRAGRGRVWSWRAQYARAGVRGQLDDCRLPPYLACSGQSWYDVMRASGVSLSYKTSTQTTMVRSEALALVLLGAVALIISGINPADRTTWWLEVFPIFI